MFGEREIIMLDKLFKSSNLQMRDSAEVSSAASFCGSVTVEEVNYLTFTQKCKLFNGAGYRYFINAGHCCNAPETISKDHLRYFRMVKAV